MTARGTPTTWAPPSSAGRDTSSSKSQPTLQVWCMFAPRTPTTFSFMLTKTCRSSLFSVTEQNKPALRKVQEICSIPFRSMLFPSYFHSFGMTENYIVFVEQPFKLDMVKLATAYFRGATWGNCLRFDQDDDVGPHTSW